MDLLEKHCIVAVGLGAALDVELVLAAALQARAAAAPLHPVAALEDHAAVAVVREAEAPQSRGDRGSGAPGRRQ